MRNEETPQPHQQTTTIDQQVSDLGQVQTKAAGLTVLTGANV